MCLGVSAAVRWFCAGTRGFGDVGRPMCTWLGACCRLASVLGVLHANL